MVTMDEARVIAAECLPDISGCHEFTTAWVFFNPRTGDAVEGPDAPVVVLKENGVRCGFKPYMRMLGGGQFLKEFRF